MRLRGGFGTLCDPIHTGFVEVFHLGEWGAICTNIRFQSEERLAGDVVCRQLGFPHGTTVDPSSNPLPPVDDGYYSSYDPDVEEATEAQERFWLNQVTCRGPEERLVDCDIGQGFRPRNAGCPALAQRLTVACRTFAVSEALEDVTTPGAGAIPDAPLCGIVCLICVLQPKVCVGVKCVGMEYYIITFHLHDHPRARERTMHCCDPAYSCILSARRVHVLCSNY